MCNTCLMSSYTEIYKKHNTVTVLCCVVIMHQTDALLKQSKITQNSNKLNYINPFVHRYFK